MRHWLVCAWLCAYSCTPVATPRPQADEHAQKASDESRDGAVPEPDAGAPSENASATGAGSKDTEPPGAGSSGSGQAEPSKAGSDPATATRGGQSDPQSGPSSSDEADDGSAPSQPDEATWFDRPREPIPPDQIEIAAETADNDALRRLADWSRLPVLDRNKARQCSSQDRHGASRTETTVYPFLADGNRDLNNFVCRGPDANVSLPSTTVTHQYDMESCPEPYVRGVALARFEGSGRMTRLYMTKVSMPRNGYVAGNEMLRIYVDDNPRPIIQVPLEDVRSGAAGEIFAMPFGSMANNSIAWYYPVVFGSKLVVALDNLVADYVYEVDAVLDDSPRRRGAPEKRLPKRDTAHSFLVTGAPPMASVSALHSEQFALAAGAQHSISLAGPATIQQLRLRVPTDALRGLAQVQIAARWDGADEPALELPLLSLFAAGQRPVSAKNPALESAIEGADQLLSLNLPMPFQSGAQWTLTNASSESVNFSLEWSGEHTVPSEEFGQLHVQFREASLPLTLISQTIAQASGRGRLVGVCADLAGHVEETPGREYETPLYFEHGDTHATADGAVAIQGSGADGYTDNAFYFVDSPRTGPFAQTWNRVEDESVTPPGQISFCRWHVLGNEIDFQRELMVSREVAQRDPTIVELHRTVAYLYLR